MKSFSCVLLAALLSGNFASSAFSQDLKKEHSPSGAQRVLTGKERLGRKWTDEQRIDNCNVPLDKRGSKPRPSACTQSSAGS